jgi:ribosomal-protein-alanine N-acetyltransferase
MAKGNLIMFRELKTDRLRLRRHEEADIPRIVALIGDYDVVKMLSKAPYPYTEEHARDWLGRLRADPNRLIWAMDNGEGLIGTIGLHQEDGGDYEIGYWLGKPYWGLGYMTEAARAVVDFTFGPLGLERLLSGHYVENDASGNVLRKLGFVYTHDEELFSLARGGKAPCRKMVLLRPAR